MSFGGWQHALGFQGGGKSNKHVLKNWKDYSNVGLHIFLLFVTYSTFGSLELAAQEFYFNGVVGGSITMYSILC